MADINSFYCPNCRQKTSLTQRARKSGGSGEPYLYEIGECNSCSQHFLVLRQPRYGTLIKTYPTSLPAPVSEDIPEPIKSDLEEANMCFVAGAFRASVTMARRAMQNICLEKGAKRTKIVGKGDNEKEISTPLVEQINWLFEQRIITAELKDWAHAIRSVGNSGAHPGDATDTETVTQSDAEDILALAEAFCIPLYVASKAYRDRHATNQSDAT